MNKRLLIKIQGEILLIECATMVPSLAVALYFQDGDAAAFLKTMALLLLFGLPMWKLSKPDNKNLRAREGFLEVAAAWVMLSVFGALPFVFSGVIPHFGDAWFESVSGFTTTGASIMNRLAMQPRGVMFWRSFTHWIGGMGVLVLTLALLPKMTGRTAHLFRAESPGPSMSKLVPKMGDTAKILYIIYGALTLVETLLLMAAGLNPYDALIHAFGTAGTGGFSIYGASVGHYQSPWVDGIITVFMIVFGINFAVYYRALQGSIKDALHSEELRWYLVIVAGAILLVTALILPVYHNTGQALRYGSFQVASIVSTTGYATQDYTGWPMAAQMILMILMLMGSCAGSTAGGVKIVRVMLLVKLGMRQVRQTFQPRKMQVVRQEGKSTEDHTLSQVAVFFFVYICLVMLGAFLISLENKFDLMTNFSAALTCVSNVGPGFSMVGPSGNFSGYSSFSKAVLSILMLGGRLEIFPMLVLFHPAAWKRQ